MYLKASKKCPFLFKVVWGLLFLPFVSTFAQVQDYGTSGKSANLYGGKALFHDQLTVGGRKVNNIQPQYGGKKINEQALYNPYLEETFRYMGKPLFSPNPYSHLQIITPPLYNQTSTDESFIPIYTTGTPIYPLPIQKIDNTSTVQKQRKETISVSPIIPALIGTIDALYRGEKDGKESKRLSLGNWYGTIRWTQSKSGNFSLHNGQGESISGNFYVSGSKINFNMNYYESGKSGYWQGSSSIWGTGSSLNLRSNIGSITGSSSSYGDIYRYRFSSPDKSYEVDIRDMGKTSHSIRVKENSNTLQYGYIN